MLPFRYGYDRVVTGGVGLDRVDPEATERPVEVHDTPGMYGMTGSSLGICAGSCTCPGGYMPPHSMNDIWGVVLTPPGGHGDRVVDDPVDQLSVVATESMHIGPRNDHIPGRGSRTYPQMVSAVPLLLWLANLG